MGNGRAEQDPRRRMLYGNARKKTGEKSDQERARRDDEVGGVDLRGEQVADQVGSNSHQSAHDGAEQDSRENDRQVFKRDPKESVSEIEEALAKDSDDHADRGEHGGQRKDTDASENRCLFFHKNTSFFPPIGREGGDKAATRMPLGSPIGLMKRDAKHKPQEPEREFLTALFVRPTTPRSVGTKGCFSNAYAFTLHTILLIKSL